MPSKKSSLSPGREECSYYNREGGGGKGKKQQGLILLPYLKRGIDNRKRGAPHVKLIYILDYDSIRLR